MEEVYYNKNDIIIEQDDIGDSFYILEVGQVKVTVILLGYCTGLYSRVNQHFLLTRSAS
jgi:CRP-like cAMP-binding protein